MRVAVVEENGDAKEGRPGKEKDGNDVVIVEGERDRLKPFSTANLDLTRTEDDALPFQVFDAKDIELSGASDVQEFLRNRLPQNVSSPSIDAFDYSYDVGDGDAGRVDLRGWGYNETVFLLNGRRMPAHYQASQGNSQDTYNAMPSLRGIPLGSIERIEILSSAGSAIYGANATGGVINIITRQDFRGGQVAVNYETPSDTHAPRRSVNLNYGLPLKGGLGLRLGASYSDSEPLRVEDRADVTIGRWRQQRSGRMPRAAQWAWMFSVGVLAACFACSACRRAKS
jgi:outer membrane receptor protein involved in Fe transport